MSFSPEKLADILQNYASQYNRPRRWVVAYSGGLDSTALLHALAAAGLRETVSALHVNHGISPNSLAWETHCTGVCDTLGIALSVERVRVPSNGGGGLEQAARRARYQAFERHTRAGDCLLQGHHLDDQAETLLLRLLRGAGPRGLGGMPETRPLGGGRLLRPLLACFRAELRDYLSHSACPWIEVESNSDESLDRNFLRRQIMPGLERRWPGFSRRWQQTAALCRETDQLNGILAQSDLARLHPRRERLGVSVEIVPLIEWLPVRRYNVLRYWVLRYWIEPSGAADGSAPLPELVHLRQLDSQLLGGRRDSRAEVAWGGHCLRIFRGRLYSLPKTPVSRGEAGAVDSGRDSTAKSSGQRTPGSSLPWLPDPGRPLILPDSRLSVEWCDRGERRLNPSALASGTVEVRWRRGGERCKPQGRGHSQTLKKLLQEYGLEPWLRDRVPLLYINGELAAVGDLWVCEAFAAVPEGPGLRLNWTLSGAAGD